MNTRKEQGTYYVYNKLGLLHTLDAYFEVRMLKGKGLYIKHVVKGMSNVWFTNVVHGRGNHVVGINKADVPEEIKLMHTLLGEQL